MASGTRDLQSDRPSWIEGLGKSRVRVTQLRARVGPWVGTREHCGRKATGPAVRGRPREHEGTPTPWPASATALRPSSPRLCVSRAFDRRTGPSRLPHTARCPTPHGVRVPKRSPRYTVQRRTPLCLAYSWEFVEAFSYT